MHYELIPHTADLGIRVNGKNLPELFENTALALFDIMTDIARVKPREKYTLEITADNLEELMNNWLTKLLREYIFNQRLLSRFKILKITPQGVKAIAKGETYNPEHHKILKEIKAVTFHNLSVKQLANGWQAEVIFDV